MPDASGIYRNVDAFDQRYQDMKHDHQKNVLKCLGMIHERAAGRAVLAELRARPAFSVYIFPFALAKVDAGFNPIKQLDEQRRKLLGG
ncbi:MAG TPA: hypothetical protein VN831_27580 [Bradyrhizobium sp.]|nr:hypothetical protein [Bradyrhizobium sp.]